MSHVLARRHAWENLDPRWTWDEECADTSNTQYEVCDGIWAHSFDRIGNGPFTGLKYCELAPPSQSQRFTADATDINSPWEHTIHNLGMNATDFSFNAYHDVHILVEPIHDNTARRMHFRQMSTNGVHPDAAAPYLDIFAKDCSVEWDGESRKCAVMVIDWRLSKAVLPFTVVGDAALVSSHRILLLHLPDTQHGPCVDLHSLATESSAGTILCRFHLPFPFPIRFGYLFTHPGSRFGEDQRSRSLFGGTGEEGWKSTVQNHSPVTQAKLFITDPRVEIVGCMLRGTERNESIFMVLSIGRMVKLYNARTRAASEPTRHGEAAADGNRYDTVDVKRPSAGEALRTEDKSASQIQGTHGNYAENDQDQTPPGPTSPECAFSWHEWGPDSSRCLPPYSVFNAGFRSTAGSRIAIWDMWTTTDRIARLAVLDFNPLPIRRAETKERMERASTGSQERKRKTKADAKAYASQTIEAVENETDTNSPVKSQAIENPGLVITDRLVARTVTAPTVTRLWGWSMDVETRLPYRIFTLRWDFDYRSVFLDNTTIIGRREQSYHFYSFLPRFGELDKTPLLGTKPTLLPPLDLVNLQLSTENNGEDLESVPDEEGEVPDPADDGSEVEVQEDTDNDASEQTAKVAYALVGDQFIEVDIDGIGLELVDMDPAQDIFEPGTSEQQ
ncbi:SubName: Full=Uncharacterized protein {ECO:0000313/EMBL:CCA68084.1} [Serendipita indica DSM 11827]|nr:SubName: Full=Uncharacterized protein {ECO:0000313/EMBL:CCA68084.1} [Serendipita indica DSM 11827]